VRHQRDLRSGRPKVGGLAGDVLLVVPRNAEPGLHDHVVVLATSDGVSFREIREALGPDVRDLLFVIASGRGVTVASSSTLRVGGELGEAAAARSQPARLDAGYLARVARESVTGAHGRACRGRARAVLVDQAVSSSSCRRGAPR
jgi:hypothetical protein